MCCLKGPSTETYHASLANSRPNEYHPWILPDVCGEVVFIMGEIYSAYVTLRLRRKVECWIPVSQDTTESLFW